MEVLAIAGASQQYSAGKIAEMEAKVEAKQIETAAASREADRKEQLASALASQNAAAGGAGISFEGSPLAVLEEDVRLSEIDKSRDEMMTRVGMSAARARGKVAKAQGKAAGIMTLIQTGVDAAGMMAGKPPSGKTHSPISTGYGRQGSTVGPSYGGTGGGRRYSKGAK
jgi:hypothetical protein